MQKYDTHFSCGNIYFGKNYPYFGSVAFWKKNQCFT